MYLPKYKISQCNIHIFLFFSEESSFDISLSGKEYNCLRLEQDILMPLAGTGKLFVYNSPKWWSQIKTAGYNNELLPYYS